MVVAERARGLESFEVMISACEVLWESSSRGSQGIRDLHCDLDGAAISREDTGNVGSIDRVRRAIDQRQVQRQRRDGQALEIFSVYCFKEHLELDVRVHLCRRQR